MTQNFISLIKISKSFTAQKVMHDVYQSKYFLGKNVKKYYLLFTAFFLGYHIYSYV